MSYQVLARKWRPGRFSELVGQEHVVSAIANALDNNRLHHAYLFTGTRGVGKTTIARIFSKSLNCEEGQGSNPCGQCATCVEIEQGNYVDLLEIDAASRTKVEDTRELLDNVQYKPTRGRFKVYLIDEVHMLSKHSFNALLKTLEEPPPHVKFLLATTDPQKLPVTILSRCLQFNLKALSREQISTQLHHVLSQESIPFEDPALALLARSANGSMRDALSLTDQAIAQGDNQVLKQVVTDMLGLMDKNLLLKLLYAVVQKDPAEVLQLVEQMAQQAPDYGQVLAELSSLLHQVALTQWVPETCKLETTSARAIFALAKQCAAEQVQLYYQIALQGRKDLPYAVDGKSALEMTLLRMMSFAPAAPVGDAEKIISELEPENITPGELAGPSSSTQPHSAQPSVAQQQQSAVNTQTGAQPQQTASTDDAQNSDESDNDDEDDDPALAAQQAAIETEASQYIQSLDAEQADQHPAAETASAMPEQPESQTAPISQARNPKTNSPESNSSQSSTVTDESMPPAFFDEMPPMDEDDGYMGDNAMPEDIQAMQDPQSVNAQAQGAQSQDANRPTGPDSEQQLTSTEDMIALRQRLKRARGQESEAAKKPEPEPSFVPPRREASKPDSGIEPVSSTPAHAAPAPETDNTASAAPVPQALPDAPLYEPVMEDIPPWDMPASASSTAPMTANEPIEPETYSPYEEPQYAEPLAQPANEPSTASQKMPKTSTVQPVEGALPAYLNNGDKLLDANQIDDWSQLISQMPVAGLVKQIVLHSAFSQKDSTVTLELDDSQAHLINDNAIAQVKAAMETAMQQPVELIINIGNPEQTPFALQQKINTMRQQYAQTVVANDALFTQLSEAFNARVIDESVKAR